jgi:tRNA uridine 5-carbamoylmethylation protein Kti12
MKLLILYGVPAVGKLTVAKEISKMTGYGLIHNHLSFDLARSVYKKDNEDFWRYVRRLRLDSIKEAHKNNRSMIITFCYAGKVSDAFVKPLILILKKLKIKFFFVHLVAEKDMLLKRVKGESRAKFGKIRDAKRLKHDLKRFGHDIAIPYVKSFRLNNSNLSPKLAAKKIVSQFNL